MNACNSETTAVDDMRKCDMPSASWLGPVAHVPTIADGLQLFEEALQHLLLFNPVFKFSVAADKELDLLHD